MLRSIKLYSSEIVSENRVNLFCDTNYQYRKVSTKINMEKQYLQFIGGNPGAVQCGNFINYYQFHPPEERIRYLPNNIWNFDEECIALDVGCNTGDLTQALYKFLEAILVNVSILAVDIDPILIRRAEECNNVNINFQSLNVMDENKRFIISNYLEFKNRKKFNVVFCFSTTMWIHLNYGDSGLKSFLKYISDISDMLIIEPQPWKCYKTAVKRMRQNKFEFSLFSRLSIRNDIENKIEYFLCNDCNLVKVCESQRTKWNRKCLVFRHLENGVNQV